MSITESDVSKHIVQLDTGSWTQLLHTADEVDRLAQGVKPDRELCF